GLIGDLLVVFIQPGPVRSLMGRVAGYNNLRQLGVGSTMAGQLVVSALGGAVFGIFMRSNPQRRVTAATMSIFVALPIIEITIVLLPVVGTRYIGLPIALAVAVKLVGFALSILVCD